MKITLCVEENKIDCKENESDIKAVYPDSSENREKNQKRSHLLRETKNKISNGWKIMSRNPNPHLKFLPPSLIQKFFKPPFLKFWLESQIPI